MGVLGSGRLANTTSTYSSCSRSREALRPGGRLGGTVTVFSDFRALTRARDERDKRGGLGTRVGHCHPGSWKARVECGHATNGVPLGQEDTGGLQAKCPVTEGRGTLPSFLVARRGNWAS